MSNTPLRRPGSPALPHRERKPAKMRRALRRAALPALLLAGGAGGPPAQAVLPLMQHEDGLPTLAPMLREVTPAVVNIAVSARVPAARNPLFDDPFFKRFFDLPPDQPLPERRRQSAGSGVIIDAERGYIVTNRHVVRDFTEIEITLKDRRRFEARLVGSDPGTDIALLEIEAGNLSALRIGDSDALEVGDFVLAIGNPFGLGQTVTTGIVSALGRSGLNIEGYEDFIQTDASINPGNSGGALVNLRGELVGINTAIIGPSGGNVGIGFAVPINMANAVVGQLLEFGEMRRGRLGIAIQDLTPDLAEAMGLPVSAGAVVARVERGSPAEESGMQAGDVVIAMRGEAVRSSTELRNRVGMTPLGESVELTILRDGERRTLAVRVGRVSGRGAGSITAPQLAGATIRELRSADPWFGKMEGVMVESVAPDGAAHRNGLRDGDLILAVNRRRVRSVEELGEATENQPLLALDILRGDVRLFIIMR